MSTLSAIYFSLDTEALCKIFAPHALNLPLITMPLNSRLSKLVFLGSIFCLALAEPSHLRAVLEDQNIVVGTIGFADIKIAYKLYEILKASSAEEGKCWLMSLGLLWYAVNTN